MEAPFPVLAAEMGIQSRFNRADTAHHLRGVQPQIHAQHAFGAVRLGGGRGLGLKPAQQAQIGPGSLRRACKEGVEILRNAAGGKHYELKQAAKRQYKAFQSRHALLPSFRSRCSIHGI